MNNRHPKAVPVRPQRVVGHSIWRVPMDGFLTPRLRQEHGAEAIGFVHTFEKEDEE